MLTLARPQSDPKWDRKVSALLRESVKIADDSPCCTPF